MKFSIANAKKSSQDLCKFYQIYINFTSKYLSHFLLLAIRIYIGWIFFNSGLTKIASIDNTIILFAYEYNLPFISPELGAYLSIFAELVFGASVILGFLTKLTALPLAIMTVIIQSLVFQNEQHFYWLFSLLTLVVYGGGLISLDGIISKICTRKSISK